MPGLGGIAGKRVKGRRAAGAGPQIVAEAMVFSAEDQGMRQIASICSAAIFFARNCIK